jgi:hypothetical protein
VSFLYGTGGYHHECRRNPLFLQPRYSEEVMTSIPEISGGEAESIGLVNKVMPE